MNVRLVFRVHAIRRMFERRITDVEVRQAITEGEVIEDYPDDLPFPSKLVLGLFGSKAIHVVIAEDLVENEIIIVTAYEPDTTKWHPDFRRRKK